MIRWPFVSRKKHQEALDAIEALRKACDEKQKVLMHYKNHYSELHGKVYHPRAKNGRFVKKTQEASPCLILN